MKADQIEILGTLRSRIKEIIALYENEKQEKDELLEERNKMVSRMSVQEKRISELEKINSTIKMTKLILAGSEDGSDARQKVNRIVREIDKCIALLNR